MNARIRPVTDRDWKEITAIFNHFVTGSFAAYPDQPVDPSFFRERRAVHPDLPFVVADTGDRVVGFAYLSQGEVESSGPFSLLAVGLG